MDTPSGTTKYKNHRVVSLEHADKSDRSIGDRLCVVEKENFSLILGPPLVVCFRVITCANPLGLFSPFHLPGHQYILRLTDLLVGATAGRDTGALLSTTIPDQSLRPLSPAYRAATVWPCHSPWSAGAGARARVSYHGANRSCNTSGRGEAAGGAPLRFYTRLGPAGRPLRHGGESSS